MAEIRQRPPASPNGELGLAIARLLTAGTYLAVVLLAIGLGAMILSGISPYAAAPTLDPARLIPDLLALRPEAFLWLGLLAAIATPTARVALAVVGFLRAADWQMAIVSIAILGVITLSVILARLAEA